MNITKYNTWRDDLIESIINNTRDALNEELHVYILRIREILTSLDAEETESIIRDIIDDNLSTDIELRINIIGMKGADEIESVNSISESARLRKEYEIEVEKNIKNALRNWRHIRIQLREALTSIVKDGTTLTLKQIALFYYYSGEQITCDNGDEKAQKYGYKSGEKLFQYFSYFTKRAIRIGDPQGATAKKLENKIELIKSVIDLLPENVRSQPSNELTTLESHLSKYYPDDL